MTDAGFQPALVVETSPQNFQVWLNHGRTLDRKHEQLGRKGTREALRWRSLECGLETFRSTRRLHKSEARNHRDVKPPNVWLEAPQARVHILDFGLARMDNDMPLTQVGEIIGTPAYMAPEQAAGTELDRRCDLFSLGCVLYQLCTGQLPFRGGNAIAIFAGPIVRNAAECKGSQSGDAAPARGPGASSVRKRSEAPPRQCTGSG